jgi:hypothetical protein
MPPFRLMLNPRRPAKPWTSFESAPKIKKKLMIFVRNAA